MKGEKRKQKKIKWRFIIWCSLFVEKEKEKKILQKAKCTIYGDTAESMVCKHFNNFRSRNFDPEDWEHSNRPAIDEDQIKKLINSSVHTIGHWSGTLHIS